MICTPNLLVYVRKLKALEKDDPKSTRIYNNLIMRREIVMLVLVEVK